MKRLCFLFFVYVVLPFSDVAGQTEPLAEQIKNSTQHEAFTVNALVQTAFRYSLDDDDFQGGRTFEAANARLSFRGILDHNFFYRIHLGMVKEPYLLDAFVGYRQSESLKVTVGAMKPMQSLDYIPNPGRTDFIDRAQITGHLVQSREVGISAEGDIGGLYYFTGIFNGNKLSLNNNNSFYGIGRLQYSVGSFLPGTFQIAAQGSYGESPGVRSGAFGPELRGERMIYGGDFRMEVARFLLAAEYMAGQLEIVDLPDKKETVSGYYLTGGYQFFKKTMLLGRWQNWAFEETGFSDDQLTVGINQTLTGIASFQLNFDAYFPEKSDDQYGVSVLFQIQF